jgi:integrase/recombinase XerC
VTYRLSLQRLAVSFADLRVEGFEAPVGTELLEEFLDREYGHLAARTYNKQRAIAKSFIDFWRARGRVHTDPFFPIESAKARGVEHDSFSGDQVRAILAENPDRRDRIALRLMLHYALRKGSLKGVRFRHFDHVRKRLTFSAKGGKVCHVPIRDSAFWHDLERLILDTEAKDDHYLLQSQRGNQHHSERIPDRPMGSTAMHTWWYGCLQRAGVVAQGSTAGERPHKARHTAGQRLLDATGNLKAVQELLKHEHISTTADIYTDWDEDRLAASLELALEDER